MEGGESKGPEASLRSMPGCHVGIHSFSVSSVISVVEKEKEVWLRPEAALGGSRNSRLMAFLFLRGLGALRGEKAWIPAFTGMA